MKKQSDLFELIKSLDKNEKRYFRLYAGLQRGQKNYLKLFDAIDMQRSYDEAKLKKKYADDKFIRQLPFLKSYLYDLLMKSLINYHSQSHADTRIHSLIDQCKILFNKALYKQYFRMLKKAKQEALKYERFGYYLQILDMEKLIAPKTELLKSKTEMIYIEAMEGIEKIRNTFDYSRLASRMLNNYRAYGISRNPVHENAINEVLSSPVMSSEDKALSARAKEIYYWIMEINYNIRADYDKMFKALEGRYKVVSSYSKPFEDNLINYRSDILYSIVDMCLKSGRTRDAEKYLQVINRTGKHKSNADRIDDDIFTIFVRFRIYLRQEETKKASYLIPELERALEAYENKLMIDTELSIRFYIVKCRIMEKDFKKALDAANILIHHPLLNKRMDYESYIKILNLLIHFELGNYSLLRYLIISTYRYLFKKEKLFKLEKLVLEFIRKLPGVKNALDLDYTFDLFSTKLALLKKDKYEKNAFEYFDFLSWVQDRRKQNIKAFSI